MSTATLSDLASRLQPLLEEAAAGRDVVVMRDGLPWVRITRPSEARTPIRFGVLEGRVKIADDFDSPLPLT